jgi:hypothetical protein
MWFVHRRHALSGVPEQHRAVNQEGRTYYVRRLGPIDQQPQVPITAEQYRMWEENDRSNYLWGGTAVLCGVAAWCIAFFGLKRTSEPRHRSTA